MMRGGMLRRHLFVLPFEVCMLGAAVVMWMRHDQLHVATSLFCFLVSLAPLLAERLFGIKILRLLQTLYGAFVFASMFSGEVLHLYALLPDWDDMIHFLSGFVIAPFVMLWLTLLKRRSNLRLPVWFEALFMVCIIASISVLWEIAEFISDQLFGTFSQGNDLTDTMMDLIHGSSGGVIMSVLWVVHAKTKRVLGIRWLMAHIEALNLSMYTKVKEGQIDAQK